MLAAAMISAAVAFADTKALALQICLDREGYSCNTIDGAWGRKCERALKHYAWNHAGVGGPSAPEDPGRALEVFFPGATNLFARVAVTKADLDSLVKIPEDAAAKADLPFMGYETVKEMFAERGHLSQRALERLNPKVDWNNVRPGTVLKIPRFPPVEEYLAAWPRQGAAAARAPEAALLRISVSNCEVTAYDGGGRLIGLFPCSIARDKAKIPPQGELRVTTVIANPNYTYTPDSAPAGERIRRHVFPGGPNCPIGVAWIGLNLPGYGIHGTVRPESVGNAESHGCFRLSNWNAARLYAMTKPGVRVVVIP